MEWNGMEWISAVPEMYPAIGLWLPPTHLSSYPPTTSAMPTTWPPQALRDLAPLIDIKLLMVNEKIASMDERRKKLSVAQVAA